MAAEQAGGPLKSKLVEDDPSFADLVEEFIAGLPERLDGMRHALDQRHVDGLKSLAHQLKGAGGGYGYPTLTELSASIEQSAASGALDDCARQLDELSATIARVVVK